MYLLLDEERQRKRVRVQAAGRGLVGLVAAFQQAGARSVLAALRQAKLPLLQPRVWMGKVQVSLAHPFFWAPFKLVGAAR